MCESEEVRREWRGRSEIKIECKIYKVGVRMDEKKED